MTVEKRQAPRVAERLLLGLLGTPSEVLRTTKNDRLLRVERSWDCGCQAYLTAADVDLAAWTPCDRHELMFFAAEPTGAAPGLSARIGSLFANTQVRIWSGPVLAVLVAVSAKAVAEANALRKRAQEAEGAALVDPLTGLYNRRGWERRVEEERKRLKRDAKPVVAIYMLDVDGLKATNDERGHAAGDAVLRHVAKVIREVTREHDVAARLGGDEFAILTIQSQAAEADLVRARLDRGFHSAALSVSIGFAFADSADTIDKAMDRADIAMYEVKKNNAAQALRQGSIR